MFVCVFSQSAHCVLFLCAELSWRSAARNQTNPAAPAGELTEKYIFVRVFVNEKCDIIQFILFVLEGQFDL